MYGCHSSHSGRVLCCEELHGTECAEAGLRQGAAFDVSEEAAEKMMENIAELETRGFTLDRPTSLPAEAVPQQDRHMSSRGMRGRCASLTSWDLGFEVHDCRVGHGRRGLLGCCLVASTGSLSGVPACGSRTQDG